MTAKPRKKYMQLKTRTALDLLRKHGWAYLTPDDTGLDGRRKNQHLCINHSTARALVRWGAAVFVERDGKHAIELVAQVA